MLGAIHKIDKGLSIFDFNVRAFRVDDGEYKFRVVKSNNFENKCNIFFRFVYRGIMIADLSFVALGQLFSLANLLVCCINYNIGSVDKHLNCIIGFEFIGVIFLLSFPQFWAHRFIELLFYDFSWFFIGDIFSNVDKAVCIFECLYNKLASFLGARFFGNIELLMVWKENVNCVNVCNLFGNWYHFVVYLFTLFQVKIRLLSHLYLMYIICYKRHVQY